MHLFRTDSFGKKMERKEGGRKSRDGGRGGRERREKRREGGSEGGRREGVERE